VAATPEEGGTHLEKVLLAFLSLFIGLNDLPGVANLRPRRRRPASAASSSRVRVAASPLRHQSVTGYRHGPILSMQPFENVLCLHSGGPQGPPGPLHGDVSLGLEKLVHLEDGSGNAPGHVHRNARVLKQSAFTCKCGSTLPSRSWKRRAKTCATSGFQMTEEKS
jgi:hypothetical protein